MTGRGLRHLAALLQVALGFLLLGVAPFDCWQAQTPVIKLGFAGALSGLDAPQGLDLYWGVRLAVEEWDASPAPGKYRVDLVSLDDEGRPEKARETARELAIDPDVRGVVGGWASVEALAALPELRRARLAAIFPIATADGLAEAGMFRLAAPDHVLARALVARVGNPARVALVRQEDWPAGLAGDLLAAALERAGAQVVVRQTVRGNQASFGPLLDTLAAARPDLVVLDANYPQVALLAREAQASRRPLPLVGGAVLAHPSFLPLTHGAADRLLYATGLPPLPTTPETAPFRDEFRKRAGHDPGADGAAAYDAARIVLQAMQRAATAGGKPVREDVRRQVPRITFDGLLGRHTFNTSGERVAAQAFVWRVVGSGTALVP